MKKILMIAAMAVMALTASAQWSINPQLGVGYSTISDMKYFGDKVSGGITSTLGADVAYQINEKLSASAGIEFLYMESDEVNKCKLKVSTFNIPVLAHYNILESLSLFAGVKFNFPVEVKESIDKTDTDVKDDCNSMLFSIPVGVRYHFNDNWNISASYQIPTTNINKHGEANQKVAPIMVTLGYTIGL